jgi:hypothetical protein
MPEADANYKALRTNFKETLLNNESPELDYKRHLEEVGGEKNSDGRAVFIDNWVDGKIRSLLFQGTPEDYQKHRYYPGDKKIYLGMPDVNQSFTALNNYLMTGEMSDMPGYTLPEVTITPEKSADDLKIHPKYKPEGKVHKLATAANNLKKFLSLTTE